MKKIFKLVVMACMTIVIVAVVSVDASAAGSYRRTYGDLTYLIRYKHVDTDIVYATVDSCSTTATNIDIPSEIEGQPVTGIGYSAFAHCDNLLSVTIPDSVRSINESAFNDCSNLECINFSNVLVIGKGAFQNCVSLKKIDLPKSLISIKDFAFYGCKNLENITIPESVENLGEHAFAACYNLTSITLPNNIISISRSVFASCDKLEKVEIPSSVKSIEAYAFESCDRITDITIPKSVLSIGNGAFEGCDNLAAVYYTGTKDEWNRIDIGNNNDKLKNANIETIEIQASGTCGESLIWNLYEDGALAIIGSGKMWEWEYYNTAPWHSYRNMIKSVEFSNDVTTIGAYAFSYCERLLSVQIPDSLTAIGSHSFYNCNILSNIELSDNITTIGAYAFSGCSSLKNVIIPKNVKFIENGVFNDCRSLSYVKIPDGVSLIGNYAFTNCRNLSILYIPSSVIEIGNEAFDGCDKYFNIECRPASYAAYYAEENDVYYNVVGYDEKMYSNVFSTQKGVTIFVDVFRALIDANVNSGRVVLALYDSEGTMIEFITANALAQRQHPTTSFVVDMKGVSYYKVFLFDIAISLKPLCQNINCFA